MTQDGSLSKSLLHSLVIDDMELGYENSLSFIGSKDSFAPNSVLENLIRNIGGSRKEHLSVSNLGGSKIHSAVFT
jgi:hypothetical protein